MIKNIKLNKINLKIQESKKNKEAEYEGKTKKSIQTYFYSS